MLIIKGGFNNTNLLDNPILFNPTWGWGCASALGGGCSQSRPEPGTGQNIANRIRMDKINKSRKIPSAYKKPILLWLLFIILHQSVLYNW